LSDAEPDQGIIELLLPSWQNREQRRAATLCRDTPWTVPGDGRNGRPGAGSHRPNLRWWTNWRMSSSAVS